MYLYSSNLFNCLFFSVVLPIIQLLGPGEHTYMQGDSANLTCKIIEGLPEPQLSWFKNGDLLSKEVNTTLILTDVTDKDEGKYICRAQNVGGDFKASVDVTVKSKCIIIIMNIPTIKNIRIYFADFSQKHIVY